MKRGHERFRFPVFHVSPGKISLSRAFADLLFRHKHANDDQRPEHHQKKLTMTFDSIC